MRTHCCLPPLRSPFHRGTCLFPTLNIAAGLVLWSLPPSRFLVLCFLSLFCYFFFFFYAFSLCQHHSFYFFLFFVLEIPCQGGNSVPAMVFSWTLSSAISLNTPHSPPPRRTLKLFVKDSTVPSVTFPFFLNGSFCPPSPVCLCSFPVSLWFFWFFPTPSCLFLLFLVCTSYSFLPVHAPFLVEKTLKFCLLWFFYSRRAQFSNLASLSPHLFLVLSPIIGKPGYLPHFP